MTTVLWYLRSRRIPVALGVSVGGAVAAWASWLLFTDDREVARATVTLTVLLMVTAFTATLAAPDENLERTASIRWPWRRGLHLLVVLAVVLAALFVTLHTGARFGPAWLVVRNAAGLLGLTALGACLFGTARAWIAPLAWTLVSATYPQEGTWWRVAATWQGQPHDSRPAATVAGVLAVAGLVAYALAGPAKPGAIVEPR